MVWAAPGTASRPTSTLMELGCWITLPMDDSHVQRVELLECQCIPHNAGEAGDGSDQSHSGLRLRTTRSKRKTRPALRANIVAKQATFSWLNLRLRGFHDSGPQENSPETGEPGTEKVDRSRTTFRNLLTMFIVLRIAPLSSDSIGERSGSQATNRDSCQPPLCFTIAHSHSLAIP